MNRTILRRRPRSGFTLIEFLVALIIGMLVMLAAVASLLGTRATAVTVGELNTLNESSVLALRLLGQEIRQAGYLPIDPGGPLSYFDVRLKTNLDGAPAFFAIQGQEAPKGAVNDTLVVGYAPAPDYFRDCLGQKAKGDGDKTYDPADPANVSNVRLITSEFSVMNGTLRCKGSGGKAAQPIIDGVERFDVLYGIAGAGGGEPVVRYVAANGVTDFAGVRTVRVCLQLAGSSRANPNASYTDCDGKVQTGSDGRLRRVYTAVFALRNQ
ncbi:type IV pilus assembly protein PilW [Variovorax sp. TBS-050B]|uniref:PilW family protein n=1 Tax=Variovorax sp. TBS-050B TaxID=2940551 RepID=UPI002473142D|nr:PilW family protein [Variovorax sp. TBS-050B]MDH6594102.1 type IV pilus assembly protein PilW [Variovorax sp. TBS-050B]